MSEKVTYTGKNGLVSDDLDKQIDNLTKKVGLLDDAFDSLLGTVSKVQGSSEKTGKSYKSNSDKVKELTELEKKLIAVQKEQEKTNKQLLAVQAQRINQQAKNVEQLERERQALNESRKALREKIASEKIEANTIDAIKQRNKDLIKQRNSLIVIDEESRRKRQELNNEIKRNTDLIKQSTKATEKSREEKERERQELDKQIKALRQRIKEEQVAKGSIEALQVETNKLVARRKQLDLTTKEGRDEEKKLARQINANTERLKEYDKAIGRNQRNVGNYTEVIGKLRAGFSRFLGAAGIFAGVIAGFVGLNKQVTQTSKLQNRLRNNFGTTGRELENQTVLVKSLSSLYDKDYNDIIQTANTVSREFGISGSEALNLISTGFEKGADDSGEFLDILKEYPAQLQAVGFEADESIAIITQQVREGVFSDKGIDAIKEAGLRLRELTPSTRDALKGIGLSADEIQRSLTDGTKSIRDVIGEVSTRLNELEDNSPAVGAAVADIFGGAGEDAGLRYLRTLKDINTELTDLPDTAGGLIAAQSELSRQWNQLITQFTTGEGKLGQFFTKAIQGINEVLNLINRATNDSFDLQESAREAIEPFEGATVESTFNNIIESITDTESKLTGLGQKLSRFQKEQNDLQNQFAQDGLFSTEQALNRATEQVGFYNTEIFKTELEIEKLITSLNALQDSGESFTGATSEQIAFLKEYGFALKETQVANEQLETGIQSEIQALNDEAQAVKDKIPEVEALTEVEKLQSKEVDKLTNDLNVNTEAIHESMLAYADANKVTLDYRNTVQKIQDAIADNSEEIRQVSQLTGESASFVVESLLKQSEAEIEAAESEKERLENRISDKERALDIELQLNEKGAASNIKRLQTEIEAEKKALAEQERLAKQAFERKKRREKAQTLINLGIEISEIALSAAQNPLNAPSAGAAGAIQFGIQSGIAIARAVANVAQIESQNFAKGTEYVNGQGTTTSDSIPANLSRGERVVPANINAQLQGVKNKDLPVIVNNGLSGLGGLGGKLDRSNNLLGSINNRMGNEQSTTRTGQKIYKNGNVITIR